MNSCPPLALVNRYVLGDCTAQERRDMNAHISRCGTCRRRTELGRGKDAVRVPGGEPKTPDQDNGESPPWEASNAGNDGRTVSISESVTAGEFPSLAETEFEGYRILEELPRGGQAVVYKAVHKATGTKVAIKVLLPHLLSSARARRHFEREVELIASLDHPNIVKIRDSGIMHGQYFFAMEYLRGQSLEQYVQSGDMSFRDRIVLFDKVCAAMTYAHQHGVIHRDLKPDNILVDERGEPHILDFGLAKTVGDFAMHSDGSAMPTMTGQWSGSLQYMSPEQAAGRPDLLDVRTDVYSLGVILYQMMTGKPPYEVMGTTLQSLQAIQQVEPVRPGRIVGKFDSDVEAILLTSLAKERSERYQSAAELHADLQNWLEGRPIRVKSMSTVYLIRKIIARHRYTSAVVGLLLLIVLCFSFVCFDLLLAARDARQELEAAVEQLTAEATSKLALGRQMAVSLFLQAWHQGQDIRAAGISSFFASEGSREQRAMAFLLDERPLAQREDEFRRSVGDSPGFADFIIGEHYVRQGKPDEALSFYRNSYKAMQQISGVAGAFSDRWLVGQVRIRLSELNAADAAVP